MKFAISSMFLAAAMCLAAAEYSPEAWETMVEAARRRPRPIIAYNDGDDLIEPLKRSGQAMVDEYLARRAAGITAPPASSLFFSMFYMMVRNPQYTPVLKQFEEVGMDAVQVQLDHARKHGVEFFADYRINDVHDEKERPDKPHPLYPKFKREHPEVLFGIWDRPTPFGLWSSLDFGKPLVRDHVMGELRSIAEKYDIDGLNIDFGREPSLFRTVGEGGDATQAQLDLMTDWMKEVRAMLTAIGKKRGRPILLAVRVPDSVGYCRAVGIDLEAWLKDGVVDLLVTGVNFRFNPWGYSSALAKKYDRPFYASVDHPEFHMVRPNSELLRRTRKAYAGRAAAALAAGADGIFYFNVMTTRWLQEFVPTMAELPKAEKLYPITDRYLYKPERHLKNGSRFNNMPIFHPHEPLSWSDETPHRFILEYGGEAYNQSGDLVYGMLEGVVIPSDGLAISSNGKTWRHVGCKGECLIYEIPKDALVAGPNELTFQLKKDAEAFLADFAVKVDPNPGKVKIDDIVDCEKPFSGFFGYRADSGSLPGPEWASTYRAHNIKLDNLPEKLLHLDNAEKPDRWQALALAKSLDAAKLGGHLLIRCRARMARTPQPPATGFLCVAADPLYKSRIYRAEFHFLADNRIVSFDGRQSVNVTDVTQFHDYEFEVNAPQGYAILRQDGRELGRWSIEPHPGCNPLLCFGDCTARIEGAVDLAYVEFKKLD